MVSTGHSLDYLISWVTTTVDEICASICLKYIADDDDNGYYSHSIHSIFSTCFTGFIDGTITVTVKKIYFHKIDIWFQISLSFY